jgi:DNA-binding IclR family transcriptional regulator
MASTVLAVAQGEGTDDLLLEVVRKADGLVDAMYVQNHLNLSKSTVWRHLRRLEGYGWLVRHRTRHRMLFGLPMGKLGDQQAQAKNETVSDGAMMVLFEA